jgi:hypothetical protein
VAWGGGDVERTHAYAAELVRFKPDVIFAYALAQLASLARETKAIPIISSELWLRLKTAISQAIRVRAGTLRDLRCSSRRWSVNGWRL